MFKKLKAREFRDSGNGLEIITLDRGGINLMIQWQPKTKKTGNDIFALYDNGEPRLSVRHHGVDYSNERKKEKKRILVPNPRLRQQQKKRITSSYATHSLPEI